MSLERSQIVRLGYYEVIVPAKPGTINSAGHDRPLHMLPVGGKGGWSVQFDELPKLIVRLELENGVIGWGEFYRDHNWETIEAVTKTLLGVALQDLALQDLPIPLCREYDGFELAIWDACAKCLGVPLYFLLGGKVQDKVKVGAWSSYRNIDEIGGYARQFQDQGFDSIKFKCNLNDDVVGWCAAIKQSAPGMKIIFDPNQRWESAGAARPLLRELEKIGNVMLIEDPLPRWQLQEYAKLRQFSSIPIVLHVSLPYIYQGQRDYDAINALMHHAVDGFNFNTGFAKFQKLAAIASTANLPCWHGSELDLGILEAAYVHQVCAARNCIWPSDIFGTAIRSHDLLKESLNINPPFIEVPTGAGIGVEPDLNAIEQHQIQVRDFK